MIYITGDTHGIEDWEKLNTSNFPEQRQMTPQYDYLIVVGDFGGIWDGAEQDKYILKTYDKRNFTTLFIDGNHENHDLLDNYPVEEWCGGKIHRVSERVIHLMRGQVYNILGTRFFVMGGAESTDKKYRKEGISWWAREMPSDEEYEEAIRNLEKVNFEVDVVLTHCAPEGYIGKNMSPVYNSDISRLLPNNLAGVCARSGNRLTKFLDDLITEHGLRFKHWYFGHYHRDMDWEKYTLVFSKIIYFYQDSLDLYYISRMDCERWIDEYTACFEGDDALITFCEGDEKPVRYAEGLDLIVKVNKENETFNAESIAKFLFEQVLKKQKDILLFQCDTGIKYAYSCVKAIEDYFSKCKRLFRGHNIRVEFAQPGLKAPVKCDESCVDEYVYRNVLEAFEKEGECWK
jgi:hypothetical protein